MTSIIKQGSNEWAQKRVGRATASRFSAILAKGTGATRAAYKKQLVAERIVGIPTCMYKSKAMEDGQELEKYARAAYMGKTGNNVKQIDFIKHPKLEAGCSPDGLVEDDGLVEIKCVIPTTQVETILRAGIKKKLMPPIHMPQVQGQLWVSGRSWSDFVSFCDAMSGDGRIFIVRVNRDDEYINDLEKEVVKFLTEVNEMEAAFRNKAGK